MALLITVTARVKDTMSAIDVAGVMDAGDGGSIELATRGCEGNAKQAIFDVSSPSTTCVREWMR